MLKKILLLFIFSLSIQLLKAQENDCDCGPDLAFLLEKIQKTPPYKDQVKGAVQKKIEEKYAALSQQATQKTSRYQCFSLLTSLLQEIKDNHLYVRGKAPAMSSEQLKDKAFMEDFRTSADFRVLPKVSWNLDSLEKELKKRPAEQIEGIYFYRDLFKIGLVALNDSQKLVGVILQTKISSWERGQTILELSPKPKQQNVYWAISGRFVNKALIHYPEFFRDGELLYHGWKKKRTGNSFYRQTKSDETFVFRQLRPDVQYLKLGSFHSFGENLKAADQFFDTISDKVTAPHVVIDLRNNTGGGDRVSKQFLKLLKKHGKKNQLYVLINYLTMSNAEQFTVRIKKTNNVKVLGMRTNGTISYGRNKAKTYTLPSGHFTLSLTDLNYSKYLAYEEVGIQPDQSLDFDKDWVEQVLTMIPNK